MREIIIVLGLPDRPMEVTVPKDLGITTIARHNADFPLPVAFPPQAMTNVLAEWLAAKGVKQVANHDLKPEMSVQYVADKVASVVESKEFDFVMCNFAPLDMASSFPLLVHGPTFLDAAVGTLYSACRAAGYVLLVTADHGNAEQMRNAETGAPHTAHTCNPVAFIFAGPVAEGYALVQDEEWKKKDGDDEEDEEEGHCAMSRRRCWI
ncbi:alkaline-phosphatase-like protein [Mycena vitilis]|nr:alkaline-phosphatase-like protein [Mycena vitilis]